MRNQEPEPLILKQANSASGKVCRIAAFVDASPARSFSAILPHALVHRVFSIFFLMFEVGTTDAQGSDMLVTALLVFLGLSTCTTATIVCAVMVGARRNRVACAVPASEVARDGARALAAA